MATKPQRLVAGFFAALFLLSSSVVTIFVIWQQASEGSKSSESATPVTDTAANTKDKNMENKLEGTQLANFTPGTPIPQLKTEDTTPGTGQTIKPGETVTVDYTGAVASTGKIFQSSKDSGQPISFSLSQVIAGWSQGIPGMKVGGTRRLYIPASLAYAGQPPQGSGIPANADLVFDVTVYKAGK